MEELLIGVLEGIIGVRLLFVFVVFILISTIFFKVCKNPDVILFIKEKFRVLLVIFCLCLLIGMILPIEDKSEPVVIEQEKLPVSEYETSTALATDEHIPVPTITPGITATPLVENRRVLGNWEVKYTPNGSGQSVDVTEWSPTNDQDVLGQTYAGSSGIKIRVSSLLNALTSQMMNPSSDEFNITIDTDVLDSSASVLSGKIVVHQECLGNRSTAIVRIVDEYGNLLYKSSEINSQSLAQSFEIAIDNYDKISFLVDVTHVGEDFYLGIVDLLPYSVDNHDIHSSDSSLQKRGDEPDYFLKFLGALSEPNDAYLYVSSWDSARDEDTLGNVYGPGGAKVGANTIFTSLTQQMINPAQENIVLNVAFGFDPSKAVNTVSGDIVVAKDSLYNRSTAIVSIIDENGNVLYESPEINSQSLPEHYSIDVSQTRKITYVFRYKQIGEPFYLGLVNLRRE